MTEYRAHTVGNDGYLIKYRAFSSDCDEHAVEWAKQLIEDDPIELWSGARLVKRLTVANKRTDPVAHQLSEGRLVPKSG